MSGLSLSYVLTTFNKLDYLKITLPLLVEACQKDEEIVVVDGGSSDGTGEYLSQLLNEKKIHTFISERDHGEAEGSNKAIFLAKGTLVKIITDDDLFDYESIQDCKRFMLEHPELDVLGFDGYSCKVAEKARFEKTGFRAGYEKWLADRSAFLFCGLSLLIRRSSLSYLGLFNPAYKIIDMEYSLRISSLNSKIAFYTAPAFVNIVNPASNSIRFYSTIRQEYKRLRRTYPEAHINFRLNNPILMMKERLSRLMRKNRKEMSVDRDQLLKHYHKLVEKGLDLLRQNRKSTHDILYTHS